MCDNYFRIVPVYFVLQIHNLTPCQIKTKSKMEDFPKLVDLTGNDPIGVKRLKILSRTVGPFQWL